MSGWNPIKGSGRPGIERIWNRYGMPTVYARIHHIALPDIYNHDVYVSAARNIVDGPVLHVFAKADALDSAKAIASALARHSRQKLMRIERRKAVRSERANMPLEYPEPQPGYGEGRVTEKGDRHE